MLYDSFIFQFHLIMIVLIPLQIYSEIRLNCNKVSCLHWAPSMYPAATAALKYYFVDAILISSNAPEFAKQGNSRALEVIITAAGRPNSFMLRAGSRYQHGGLNKILLPTKES